MNAFAVAFVLFALIETLGPISGAHLNPAVTLSMLATRQMDRRTAAYYVISQFAGAFVGLLATHLMFYDTRSVLVVISENAKTPGLFFGELLGTFLLVSVILGCIRGRSRFTALSIGAVVGGMLITTSSTMYANPAVTFARMFTYAICGIAPSSALFFVAAEVTGALLATSVFAHLYPGKSVDRSATVIAEMPSWADK
ncbi:MAG: hypothetical protein FJ151_04495 [Euryarchaeota archaeon]|nr:hypothetical protein [Euryarchaeota archaeon]